MIVLMIERNDYKYIERSKEWIETSITKDPSTKLMLLKVHYLFWGNESKDATLYLEEILPEVLEDEESSNLLTDVLTFIIAKGLVQYTYNLFQKEEFQLKDRYKVPYYTLMTLLKDEYPNEIKKMGKELEEPVEEMVAYIEELEEKYQ